MNARLSCFGTCPKDSCREYQPEMGDYKWDCLPYYPSYSFHVFSFVDTVIIESAQRFPRSSLLQLFIARFYQVRDTHSAPGFIVEFHPFCAGRAGVYRQAVARYGAPDACIAPEPTPRR